VDSLAAGPAQSWFVVKVAVALSPILILWAAGVIGWFLRRPLWRRSGVGPQSGGHPLDELVEARRSSRPLQNCTEPAPVLNADWRPLVNDPVTKS
jgi:hypothetical protein